MMENIFKPRISKIIGISDRRRLPRLGKIRLGVKIISKKTGNEYPKEVDYFVCPPEVIKAYKEEFPDGEIKILDIMFPVNNIEVIFPQAYKFYGKTKGLKCAGNGEIAYRAGENGSFKEISCPCEKLEAGQCSQRGNLMVLLPKVNLGGIYQIDIGSYHSIVDVNSGIDYVRAVMTQTLGLPRFAMIPLILKREPRETHYEGGKQIHYTLRLFLNVTIEQLNEMKQDNRILQPPQFALPPVEEINPEFDEGAVVEEETEQDTKQKIISKEVPTITEKTGEKSKDKSKELTKQQLFGLKLTGSKELGFKGSHTLTDEEKKTGEEQIRDPYLETGIVVNDIKVIVERRKKIETILTGENENYKGVKIEGRVLKWIEELGDDEKIKALANKIDWNADADSILAYLNEQKARTGRKTLFE